VGSGLATLLMDLLTREEEAVDLRTGHLRFDIGLLARRVVATIDWLASGAVVSRGGRPDLAGEALRRVRAPTLLRPGRVSSPISETLGLPFGFGGQVKRGGPP
jgi:hypothetical protein